MNKVYIAKQKIFNAKGKTFAHELLFRDHKFGIKKFPSNIKATSQVILNTLTKGNFDEILGEDGVAFVNIDEEILLSGVVDILDKKRFVLEILETTDLNEKVVSKVIQYHKRGFKIAIDDFDCSLEMIRKFTPLLKYIHIIKIDVIASEPINLKNVTAKIKKIGIKLLAEKVETKEEYTKYLHMGFELFQGYYLHEPEPVEIDNYKDISRLVILHLIKIIKDDGLTGEIESYIKQRADLSYKLIKFINNQEVFETHIESITQIITLLGREKLMRWLLMYLYAEVSSNPSSADILNIATNRAEKMEAEAHHDQKDKAYIAGMFTMLGPLFEMDIKDIMKNIKMDRDIVDLVVEKKGRFFPSLAKVEESEKDYLKQLMIKNFDKLDVTGIVQMLGSNSIYIDKTKL